MDFKLTEHLPEEEAAAARIWNLKEVILEELEGNVWPAGVRDMSAEARQTYAAALHLAAEELWA